MNYSAAEKIGDAIALGTIADIQKRDALLPGDTRVTEGYWDMYRISTPLGEVDVWIPAGALQEPAERSV